MGSYIDMTNDSYKGIGAYANWFARSDTEGGEVVFFEALDLVFTAGYHCMEHFIATVDDSSLLCEPSATLTIKSSALDILLLNWDKLVSFVNEFSGEN